MTAEEGTKQSWKGMFLHMTTVTSHSLRNKLESESVREYSIFMQMNACKRLNIVHYMVHTFNLGDIPYEQSEANDLLHREQFLFSRPCGPTWTDDDPRVTLFWSPRTWLLTAGPNLGLVQHFCLRESLQNQSVTICTTRSYGRSGEVQVVAVCAAGFSHSACVTSTMDKQHSTLQ